MRFPPRLEPGDRYVRVPPSVFGLSRSKASGEDPAEKKPASEKPASTQRSPEGRSLPAPGEGFRTSRQVRNGEKEENGATGAEVREKELWRRKPGDRVIRVRVVHHHQMRKVLGVPALYSAGYGNVGSSIYYALGVVTIVAMGAAPLALGIAGILFLFVALTYAEGSAMFPEAGGSASFARHAFNDMVGFVAGWALMLSYTVTIAISAFIISPYLGYFWEPFKSNLMVGTLTSSAIVVLLMLLNVLGVRETSMVNIFIAFLDISLQLLLILLGVIFLISPHLLSQNVVTYWPGPSQFIFGIALAALAYTGVETVSQMAEETRRPQLRVPRALMMMVVTVLVVFIGVTVVAFSVMTPNELATNWGRDPIAGIAYHLPIKMAEATPPAGPVAGAVYGWFVQVLQRVLPPLVAVLAATILLIATNAGVMGISRLAFSMGRYRQLPAVFSRVHRRFRTPYISIILFSIMALLLLLPGFFRANFVTSLGALYTFGSLLSFALAHLSIIALRVRRPELPRPFKKGPNLRVRGREVPLSALLGLVSTTVIWLVILYIQPYSRLVGLSWMVLGLLLYLLLRKRLALPAAPEKPQPLTER